MGRIRVDVHCHMDIVRKAYARMDGDYRSRALQIDQLGQQTDFAKPAATRHNNLIWSKTVYN